MTDNNHPITPPLPLIQQWVELAGLVGINEHQLADLANRAAQWGSDQELEACCEWFVRDWTDIETADKLRAARRPNPKSLAEEALEAIDEEQAELAISSYKVIRCALERLQELEG